MNTLILFGFSITYYELIGVIFYILSVYLAVKINKWTWPTSIVAQVFFFILYWNNNLFGNAFLQIFFTYICIVGWLYWKKTDNTAIKRLKSKDLELLSLLAGTSIMIMSFLIPYIFPTPQYPVVDSTITVLSIFAVYLMAYKNIEAWYIWMIANILSIIVCYKLELYLMSAQNVLFLMLDINGLVNWLKHENALNEMEKT